MSGTMRAWKLRRLGARTRFAPAQQIFTLPPFAFGIDSARQFGMMRRQGAEIGEIEDQKRRRQRRHHIGAADRIPEQGKLAEECSRFQPNRRRFDVDFDFAVGDEIHAIADPAAADHGGALGDFHPAQHMGDFGDCGRVKRLEEAILLREQHPDIEIVVMGGFLNAQELLEMAAFSISTVVHSAEQVRPGQALTALTARTVDPRQVALDVDELPPRRDHRVERLP